MAMRCMVCGGKDSMEQVSENKMRIKYICECGTLYTESRRKRKVRKR